MAAAAGLILALVVGSFYQQERDARMALQEQLGDALGNNATLLGQASRLDSILLVLASPTVRTATLAGTGLLPSGRLLWDDSRGVALLAVAQFPPAQAGRTYQAWGIVEGQDPVSLGTFGPGPGNRILVELRGPAGERFDIGAISEEPEGGSPAPTTTPLLVGTLSGSGAGRVQKPE